MNGSTNLRHRVAAHLWLEWRESRVAIVGVLLATVLLSVAAAAIGVRAHVALTDAPSLLMVLGAALVVFTLGSEVLSRELSREGRSAIPRLPGGLLVPFAVRTLVFLVVLVLCAAIGRNLTAFAIESLGGKLTSGPALVEEGKLLATIGLVAIFGLAGSCWLRQSTLAAPLGMLLVGILVLGPFAIEVDGTSVTDLLGESLQSAFIVALLCGLLAAWTSFTRGLRHGAGRRAAAMAGLLTLAIGLLPIHGYAAYRAMQWLRCDPLDPDFRIQGMMVGTGGRHAFLRTGRRGDRANYTVSIVLDLETGAWKKIGHGLTFHTLEGGIFDNYPLADDRTPQRYVRCVDWESRSVPYASTLYDGATGEPIGEFSKVVNDSTWKQRFLNEARGVTPIRLPDGRHVFALDDDFYRDRPDGSVETLEFPKRAFRMGSDGHDLFYKPIVNNQIQPARYRDLWTDEDAPIPGAKDYGGWRSRFDDALVVDVDRKNAKERVNTVELLEDDGTRRAFPGLSPDDLFVGTTSQGDAILLVVRTADYARRDFAVELMHPGTHERRAVHFEDGSPAIVSNLGRFGAMLTHTPIGSVVLRGQRRIGDRRAQWFLARLDEASATIAIAPCDDISTACVVDGSTALVVDNERSIVRVHFGSNESEILFPRRDKKP